MKALNIFWTLLFVAAAVLQYNDPDPYLWIPLYLYGAFLCYRAVQRKFHSSLYLIGLAIYIPYALYLFFDTNGVLSWIKEHNSENLVQTMKATRPWIEETREFFGLLLLTAALLLNVTWLRRGQYKGQLRQTEEHV